MRKLLPPILVLIAAGVLAWAFLRPPGRPEQTDRRGVATDAPAAGPRGESAAADVSTTDGGTIEGVVLRAGRAVAARIEIRRIAAPSPRPELRELLVLRDPLVDAPPLATGSANEDGAFRFSRLVPGTYRLDAYGLDGARGEATVRLRVPGRRSFTPIVLRTGPHALRGRAILGDRPFRGLVSAGRWVATDKDGRFEVTGLGAGLVHLEALVPGSFHASGPWVRVPRDGDLVFDVGAGCSVLAGRVVDAASGRPISGAEVLSRGGGGADLGIHRRVLTDAEGRFSLALPRTERWIAARAEGFWPRELLSGLDGPEVEVSLMPAARLTGRVVAAGAENPVARVPVYLTPAEGVYPGRLYSGDRTTTDEAGRFAFGHVPEARVVVRARGNGWASQGLGDVREGYNPFVVELDPNGTRHVELIVERAVRVGGRVLGPDGESVPGAIVLATSARGSAAPQTESTASDSEGVYLLDGLVPTRRYDLSASSPGFSPATPVPVSAASGETVEVNLELPAARFLAVLVLDDLTSEPIAGARVLASVNREVLRAKPSWLTGEDGRLALGPLAAGDVGVRVEHDLHDASARVEVAEDALAEGLEVRLTRSVFVEGVVLRPDGKPVTGGDVTSWGPEGVGRNRRWTRIDGDGRFRLGGLSPGEWDLTASARIGGTWLHGKTRASPGAAEVVIRLDPPEEDEEQDRRVLIVLDPDGEPVGSGRVYLKALDADGEDTWTTDVPHIGGRVEFERQSGEAQIWIEVRNAAHASGAPVPFGAIRVGPLSPDQARIVIRLRPEKTIAGLVVGPDGVPRAGVRVGATPDERDSPGFWSEHGHAYTDPSGAFRIGRLGDGPYQLLAMAAPGTRYVMVRGIQGGTSDLRIELAAATTAAVSVVDPSGSPVAGARVVVIQPNEHLWFEVQVDRRTTDGRGRAEPERLDAKKTYALRVEPPAGRRDIAAVRIAPWRPAATEVRLPPGLTVQGVVRSSDGRASGVVRIWARSARDTWMESFSRSDGSFEVGPFPAGVVEIAAPKGSERPFESETLVRTEAGRVGVLLTRDAGSTLSVRVRNWPKGESGWATVESEGEGRRESDWIADGTARIDGLDPRNTYVLWITTESEKLVYFRRGVRLTAVPLEVDLVPARRVTGRVILPPGAQDVGVSLGGEGLHMDKGLGSDGRFSFAGVPEGIWTVTVTARVEEARARGESRVEAGSTDVVIRASVVD